MTEMNASWSYSFIIRQALSLRWPAYLLFLTLSALSSSHSVQQRHRFKPSSERRHSQPRGAGGQSRAICFLLSFLRPRLRDSPRTADRGFVIADLLSFFRPARPDSFRALRPAGSSSRSVFAFDSAPPFSTTARKGAF